jgi:putative ABC transport system permease protein
MLFLKQIKESFVFAIESITSNRLRTLLSLLGITIGIFAIIAVFTILDSIENNIKKTISTLGDDVVYIQKWPWEFSEEYQWWKYLKRPVPKLEELNEIKRRSKLVEAGAYMISSSKTIQHEDITIEGATMIAASKDYDKIRNFELLHGRYISDFEAKSGKNIAVIGHDIADGFFGSVNPVGKEIKLMNRKVRIIGVFKKEGQDLIGGLSSDNVVLIPIQYAKKLMDIQDERNNPMIMLKAKKDISALELTDELHGIMRAIRRLKPKEDDDFALNRTSLLTQGFDQLFGMITIVSAIIGGFAILVGAFGIANIMFVSVKERTRQIGIQKALGAKNYFILFQFLYESVILSLIGGILGLLLIYLGTIVGSNMIDMELILSTKNIIIGLVISVAAGFIAGYIPASKASKLNPVAAMNSTF